MITFAQTTHSMWFHARTTKWKYRKLGCITWYFYSCVRHILTVLEIIITLNTILLVGLFYILSLIHHTVLHSGSKSCFGISLARLMSLFKFEVWISTCLSYPTVPGSCKVFINMDKKRLYVVFKSPTTYFRYPGVPTPR